MPDHGFVTSRCQSCLAIWHMLNMLLGAFCEQIDMPLKPVLMLQKQIALCAILCKHGIVKSCAQEAKIHPFLSFGQFALGAHRLKTSVFAEFLMPARGRALHVQTEALTSCLHKSTCFKGCICQHQYQSESAIAKSGWKSCGLHRLVFILPSP